MLAKRRGGELVGFEELLGDQVAACGPDVVEPVALVVERRAQLDAEVRGGGTEERGEARRDEAGCVDYAF
jgi:hypothetical protein